MNAFISTFVVTTCPLAIFVFYQLATLDWILEKQENPLWSIRLEFFVAYPKIIIGCMTGEIQKKLKERNKSIFVSNILMLVSWGVLTIGVLRFLT